MSESQDCLECLYTPTQDSSKNLAPSCFQSRTRLHKRMQSLNKYHLKIHKLYGNTTEKKTRKSVFPLSFYSPITHIIKPHKALYLFHNKKIKIS